MIPILRCRGTSFFGWCSATTGGQRGVTLIEALITLLVITIGLLGVAALQVIGVQEGTSAFRASQAIWLAYDMADRMRANLDTTAADGDWADHYKTIDVSADNVPPQSDHDACDGASDSCNFQQIANYDAFEWWQLLQQFPSANGTVTEPGPNGRYLVRITWGEERPVHDPDLIDEHIQVCPSDPSIQQACIELWVQP